ncbi:MAG: cation diffusion facilitator family transporter [Clostridium sp.]
MLSNFLVTRFIKNHDNVSNRIVRNSYGYLGGTVGLILNLILFLVKLSIGIISGSIAVTADAFNNLSDSASSLITILGFKLSSKPPDKEHPFGHGRIEYISALIVSFLVLLVGIQFIKSSFNRIINPEPISFNLIIFSLLTLSILIKIWMGKFNVFLGNKINSQALKAASKDAFADVITSSVVASSLLLSNWISFPIDGYIGICVALFIIYSGISLIKDTLDPLLGAAPEPELVTSIRNKLLEYQYISGVHDLIIHNYGPGRCIATIHAEVPINSPIVKIHEVIDKAERQISRELNLTLVIHMDPINTDCEEVQAANTLTMSILNNFPDIKSMHDFRVVGEGDIKNIIFDIVVDADIPLTLTAEDDLVENINLELKKFYPEYNAIITVDRDFLGIS